MKKICNYTLLKLSSYKIVIILGLLFFYHLIIYFSFLTEGSNYNIYDLFISEFRYFSLFVVYSLGYLLIIYNVNQKNSFYKYYYLRFNNKLEVYNTNVITLAFIALLFTVFINVLSLAEGIFTLPLTNSYSEYFCNNFDNVEILTQMINPFNYVLLTSIFSLLYFFLQGLLYFVIDTFLNKDGLSLIIVIAINTLNRFLDSLGGIIPKLSFTNNIYFITSQIDDISNYSFIFFRILYWFILILFIYLIGSFKAIKMDYKFIN